MRALILLFSAVVLILAALIVVPSLGGRSKGSAPTGRVFDATRLIADASAGEYAVYRDERGETWTFKVETAVPGGAERPPRIRVWSIQRDPAGNPLPNGSHVYDHLPTRHGLYPLMAPADPDGYDRIWVWDRIRRATLPWQGKPKELWRVDLIDPALPQEAGADHVVAWLDESVPVFGLVQWQRRGRTWDLIEWGPR